VSKGGGGAFALSSGHPIDHAANCLTEKEKGGRLDPAFELKNWLRELDLNQRPSGYEPDFAIHTVQPEPTKPKKSKGE
jgi:hypothetical protein